MAHHGTQSSPPGAPALSAGGPGELPELDYCLPAHASPPQKREASYSTASAIQRRAHKSHRRRGTHSPQRHQHPMHPQVQLPRLAARAVPSRAGTGGAGRLRQRRGSGGGKEGGRADHVAAALGELVRGEDQLAGAAPCASRVESLVERTRSHLPAAPKGESASASRQGRMRRGGSGGWGA